jgi:predicted component of type VI protein secretion system
MKLSLVVLAAGQQKGKMLEIKLEQFVVGRDPQCHLRPASPMISKRHCALIQRDNKAFVHDFDSTNGTFVNNQQVKGEVELHNQDQLKIGPLLFEVRLEAGTPVNRPTPAPPTKAAKPTAVAAGVATPAAEPAKQPAPAEKPVLPEKPAASNDDDIAAMLLSIQDDGQPRASLSSLEEVPEGSTVMDVTVPPPGAGADAAKAEKEKAKAAASGNTSSAAKSILEKYMRRPRS